MSNEIMIPDNQAKAWLGMAAAKNDVVVKLQKMELYTQSVFLEMDDSWAYEAIDVAAAKYRKKYTEIIEARKEFTNKINAGIIEPLMAYEKRLDPKENQKYLLATSRSLALRKKEAEDAAKANQKNAEIARFKAHVENEFFRMARDYRVFLRKEIIGQYEIALKAGLSGDNTDIKNMLGTLPVPTITKFNTALLSTQEMMSTYATIPKINFADILKELYQECDEIFANFDSDKANITAALEHQEKQNKLAEIAETKKVEESQAMNTLIHTSEATVISEPKIKVSLYVETEESEQWAKAVIAFFIVNLHYFSKYNRSKTWSAIKIGQMADFLGKLATDHDIKSDKLTYLQNEK